MGILCLFSRVDGRKLINMFADFLFDRIIWYQANKQKAWFSKDVSNSWGVRCINSKLLEWGPWKLWQLSEEGVPNEIAIWIGWKFSYRYARIGNCLKRNASSTTVIYSSESIFCPKIVRTKWNLKNQQQKNCATNKCHFNFRIDYPKFDFLKSIQPFQDWF